MSGKQEWKQELFRICSILKSNGVDLKKIPTNGTAEDGKRIFISLKDIKIAETNIDAIIVSNGLDPNFSIGRYLNRLRMAYNGTKGKILPEDRLYAEQLGIVHKQDNSRQLPIFKGRKISQFHMNFIQANLDKILTGELNIKEVLKLLEEEAIEKNETIIKDSGSIKRIVLMLLKDRPQEQERYLQITKQNRGQRQSYKGKVRKPKIGTYHEEQLKLKENLISTYLPRLISGEITMGMIEEDTDLSHKTINKFFTEYYQSSGDEEAYKEYEKAKQANKGPSLTVRKRAADMRNEVSQYRVVSSEEFLLLSEEKQEEQILMKKRQEQLQRELRSKTNLTIVPTKETTQAMIERARRYFKGKNNPEHDIEYFSDGDIRYILFRFPTLIGRAEKKLDQRIGVLQSYDEISEEKVYEMIKQFAGILIYDVERTKSQLDMLKRENLIDYAISRPNGLMISVNLMYALIQFAKERLQISDLSNVNRNSIFINNNKLKRLYGLTNEQLKARYPYDKGNDEVDQLYVVTADDIGKATYRARGNSEEAKRLFDELVHAKEELK